MDNIQISSESILFSWNSNIFPVLYMRKVWGCLCQSWKSPQDFDTVCYLDRFPFTPVKNSSSSYFSYCWLSTVFFLTKLRIHLFHVYQGGPLQTCLRIVNVKPLNYLKRCDSCRKMSMLQLIHKKYHGVEAGSRAVRFAQLSNNGISKINHHCI